MKRKIPAIIMLLRPSNFLIAVASIAVACFLAGGTPDMLWTIAAAALGGGLIGAGGMVINDLYDIEIDRFNKPDRPLPSGVVSKQTAVILYVLLSVGGLASSFFTTMAAFSIAAVAVPLIFIYSAILKRTPLVGNVTVAFLTGLAFLYGGAAVGNMGMTIVPALFAFLINVGREIIKDMEDVEGDARQGARTFPVVQGMNASRIVATIALAAVIFATVIPFVTGFYGWRYFVLVNAGVNLVLLYVLYQLWMDMSITMLHRLSSVLKYDMAIGLVAILLG